MGVDHRRADVRVAQEFLHSPNVRPALEQVRRKRVAKGVAPDTLGNASTPRSVGDGPQKT